MKRKGILLVLILILSAYLGYRYLNKGHRNINSENAVIEIESTEFYVSFKKDQALFNKNYLDKTVQLHGSITEIEGNGIILDAKNYINFKDSLTQEIKLKDQMTIKGRYVGYDDLLDQLKIDQASIVKE
ncbi:MAG: hypothetical protein QNJ57_05220 [Flavobacteriaceae bacterium]|nr:hypothetical protein [Flavobacteriaceae bacterium]